MQPLRCRWQNLPHPGWNRVKVSENLGVTAVAPVAPAVTSLLVDSDISLKTVIIYLLMQWEDLNQNQFWSQTNNNPGTLAGSVAESKLLL